MTYDNTGCKISVGTCPFMKVRMLDDLMREQPRDIHELNNFRICADNIQPTSNNTSSRSSHQDIPKGTEFHSLCELALSSHLLGLLSRVLQERNE